ncbi:MAG: ABC transporter permease subunit [Chloroflexota bacterium]|jgi:NitT/TauT family transport system permease protein
MGLLQNTAVPPKERLERSFTLGDLIVILFLVALLYGGARLAFDTPAFIEGPQISLSPSTLPWYTLLSVGRMLAAYILSLFFTLTYGRMAAYNRRAETILMPLLDVLQSVPILSFLPIVLLGLSAILPQRAAAELASIVLIFTSQAWNMTFGWYQSLTTIPKELREASAIFRLNAWLRFKRLELPFGMIGLIWNSIMSWAGGWFFLMAAEIFTVGSKDFRLPGLGAYLHEAANQGDFRSIAYGLTALILTIVALDQFVWRPLLAWADRFKVEMVESDEPPTSWFYDLIHTSRLFLWINSWMEKANERFDRWMIRRAPMKTDGNESASKLDWRLIAFYGLLAIFILYGGYRAAEMLVSVPWAQWRQIGVGVLATFLRVSVSLIIALLWTIPVGVAIGTNRRAAAILQPIVQVTAAVPATAIFPVILLFFINMAGGLNIAAVFLMLMGTQWYLLFNIIAGASAIPQDLKYTSALLGLSRWERWRTLILPALFPFVITGAITASGGAWNASIVAEYVHFGGRTLFATGVGSLISQATANGDYPLLLASTLSMVLAVVLVNRLFWRRLYKTAEEKYRME